MIRQKQARIQDFSPPLDDFCSHLCGLKKKCYFILQYSYHCPSSPEQSPETTPLCIPMQSRFKDYVHIIMYSYYSKVMSSLHPLNSPKTLLSKCNLPLAFMWVAGRHAKQQQQLFIMYGGGGRIFDVKFEDRQREATRKLFNYF